MQPICFHYSLLKDANVTLSRDSNCIYRVRYPISERFGQRVLIISLKVSTLFDIYES